MLFSPDSSVVALKTSPPTDGVPSMQLTLVPLSFPRQQENDVIVPIHDLLMMARPLAFSSDGRLLAIVDGRELVIYDRGTDSVVYSAPFFTDRSDIIQARFAPNQPRLYITAPDLGSIYVIDLSPLLDADQ